MTELGWDPVPGDIPHCLLSEIRCEIVPNVLPHAVFKNDIESMVLGDLSYTAALRHATRSSPW